MQGQEALLVATQADLVHVAWENVCYGEVLSSNGSKSKISPRAALSPCHGTWAEISVKLTPTPSTPPGTEGHCTFWWQFIVQSVCCTVNPDWGLSLVLMAEAPSCTTPYICTHAFACINKTAE